MSNINTCPTCRYYDEPGFILRGWRVAPCDECNPGNARALPVPLFISVTVARKAAA